jgi:outer membrane protein OmpA-like peptidoglycan-associated protein
MLTFPSFGTGPSSTRRWIHRLVRVWVVFLSVFFAGATPAMATHLQGGYFTAKVTSDGRLQGTLTYLEVNACASGVGTQKALTMSITSPGGQVVSKTVNTVATRCLSGGSTYVGSFDYPLDATTFSAGAADGTYTLEWTAGNRIAGIVNLASSSTKSVRFRAKVRKITGIATSAPLLGSNIATGIGIGDLYSQNLNASDPDDVLGTGTLTYVALTGDTDLAPGSNIIDVSKVQANGQVEISAATTAGMTNNTYYVYKIRVTDDQGDMAERDVLLRAVSPNHPPVINGLNTTTGYDINAGATQVISFNATDPDVANTVAITGAGLPSWATLVPVPGNPATAVLTLSPPAGLNTRTFRLNFDAADNDSTQVLTGSRTIEVRVAGTPDTQLLTWPSALTTATSATFTFAAADAGSTFECSIDGGSSWQTCTSPQVYTGLADGARTFSVRATLSGMVDPTPATYGWTIDTTAPTTVFGTKPSAVTASATANFTFSTNDLGVVTYQCSLDGVAFSLCPTPKSYSGLADGSHTLQVKATDALGNIETSPASYTWTVDRTAPDTSFTATPVLVSTSPNASFSFSATEPGSTFECRIDGGAYGACTSPRSWSGLADGSHTVDVRATDAVGNTDASPASYAWVIDATAPDTSLGTKPAALTNTSTANFTFSSPDATAVFECRTDGGAWASCGSPLALTGLSDGAHTFSVRAVDPVGNVDATPQNHSWTIDTAAPSTTVTSQPASLVAANSATVGFNSADAGASFECKLDGGSWTSCSSPRALTGLADGAHTLRIRATDAAGNVEASPAVVSWTVDTTAPSTTVGDHPASLTQATAASIEFSSADSGATFECKLDGGDWSACTSPEALTGLADGDHTLRIRATDVAGNVESSPAVVSWTVDTTAPSTSVTSQPASLVRTASASVGFQSSDSGATFECMLDGGGWAACTSPRALTGLADGDHTLRIRATDAAGNVESSPAVVNWTVDTVAPSTTVGDHPASLTQATAASIEFSSADSTATFECKLDGGDWAACTSPDALTGLADGDHTLRVRATDAAGNVESSPAVVNWTVDTTAPSTTVGDHPASLTQATAASIEFSSADSGATFECKLDGGDWAACTSAHALTGLADGDHTLRVRATDAAGNVESSPAVVNWTVDTTAPSTTVGDHPASLTQATAASIEFSSADSTATFECKLDGGDWAACTSPDALTGLADGDHTLRIRATDAAGNVEASPAVVHWTVDTTAPSTTVGDHPASLVRTASASVEFTSADSGATFECKLDSGDWAACTSPDALTGLADGDHTLRIRATDAAGNVESSPAVVHWTVDTVAPSTTVGDHPASLTQATAASIEFSSADPTATFECKLDSGDWAACTSPHALTGLADGDHTLRVRATDAAGNVEASPAVVHWTVDTTAPSTTVGVHPASLVRTASASVEFTSADPGATFECKLDSGDWAACTSPNALTGLADGDHTLRIRATDAAGNVESSPAVVHWTVDTVAPSTTVGAHPASLVRTSSASVEFTSADPAATFECKLDSGDWAACTSPDALTGLDDGDHTLQIRATDAAGNVESSPAVVHWTVDTGSPSTHLTSAPAALVASSSASVAFTSADPHATFECKLDSGDWAACTSPHALTGLADGDHTLQVRATDAAGNVESTPAVAHWTVDTAAPATSVTARPEALVRTNTAVVAFTSADPHATFACKLDGADWAPCTAPHSVTGLADGDHTLRIRATDPAGNTESAPAVINWTVDTTAPASPRLTAKPAPNATTTRFTIDREPGTQLQCQLDGGAWADCASPYAPTIATDGVHTAKFRQVDDAGNVSVVTTYQWTLDRAAPAAPAVLSGPAAQTPDRSATFELAGESGAAIECRVDGGAWAPCASPLAITSLELGDHTLELRATDLAGNVSPVRIEHWTVTKAPDPAPAAAPAASVPTVSAPAHAGPKAAAVEIARDVTVDPTASAVGCRLSGANITDCSIAIFAKASELGLAPAGTPKGDALVRIGTGYEEADGTTGRVGVKIVLNPTGKAAVARPGGVKVRVDIKAHTADGGKPLEASKYSRLRRANLLVVPSDGLFATDSAVISGTGKRYLKAISGRVRDARAITCTGHTDSQGALGYNRRLGLARAKAVCAYLVRLRVKARKTARSAGESRPRATNSTARGRALNRRVELAVRFK